MKSVLRETIPKLTITQVGTINNKGVAEGWAFDGKSHPDSVGEYFSIQNEDVSHDCHFIGGYTIDELREINK